jgi:hypothetical protein
VTAAIFWMKTGAGWKETSVQELQGPKTLKIRWLNATDRNL